MPAKPGAPRPMGWGTKNELRYLDGLVSGQHIPREMRGIVQVRPRKLLENYLRSAEKRTKDRTWGPINGETVTQKAQEMLAALPKRDMEVMDDGY